VGDLPRAQRLADRFAHLNWPRTLNRYARQVVPQPDDVLHGCRHPQIRYWVAAQAEQRGCEFLKARCIARFSGSRPP
jgi:hypothetical protein